MLEQEALLVRYSTSSTKQNDYVIFMKIYSYTPE